MKIADAFGWFYHFYNLTIEGLVEEDFNEFNIIDNKLFYNTFGSMSYEYKKYELNRLMKSDYFGANFKILMDDLICEKRLGFCDFVPIYSLTGVILTNRYDKSFIEASLNLPKSRWRNYNEVRTFEDLDDFKETYISFNFGEKFTRIPAPEYSVSGLRINCDTDCYLNIHLQSSIKGWSMPKSTDKAPGLIIASGSVSKYLVEKMHDEELYVGVFLSRDGGLNWKMINRGKFIFEILDKGSIIIIGPKGQSTSYIKYSLDSGDTWNDLLISESPVLLYAITVKEENHLKKFLISTRSPKNYKAKSMVITVDISNLHERDCEHIKDDQVESDYEEWAPHTADEDGCVDGRRITIVRKKPDRKCFNPENFTLIFTKSRCECSDDDYHCDFGYVRSENGYCVKDPEINETISGVPPHCDKFYFISDGYRKNYESFCEGGVQHELSEKSCRSNWHIFSFLKWPSFLHFPSFKIFGGTVGWLLKLIVLAGIGYGLYKAYILNYHYYALDKMLMLWNKLKEFRQAKRVDSNVYSELQQKQFTLDQNLQNKNIESIFEVNEETEETENLDIANEN